MWPIYLSSIRYLHVSLNSFANRPFFGRTTDSLRRRFLEGNCAHARKDRRRKTKTIQSAPGSRRASLQELELQRDEEGNSAPLEGNTSIGVIWGMADRSILFFLTEPSSIDRLALVLQEGKGSLVLKNLNCRCTKVIRYLSPQIVCPSSAPIWSSGGG